MSETTVEDLLAQIQPREVTVRILLRQELQNRHNELDAQLTRETQLDATENRHPVAPGLAAEIKALEAEMEEALVPFTFRAIGQRRWADLLAQHPPTKDQKKTDPRADMNPVTFPIVAIAASCVQPKMTEEDVGKLYEHLGNAQWVALWDACVSTNLGTAALPKSWAASAIAQMNAASGITHAPEVYPEASSLAAS